MKFARSFGIVLAAAVIPAVAAAQDQPYDPNQPQPQQAPQQTPAPPPAPQPAPVTTTTTNNPPPVVVVNPNAPPPQAGPTYVQPEGNEVYDDWNAPVFATGALVFGGSYAAAAITSSESNHPGADRLWVPVAGPWLALNDWGNCPIENPSCDQNTTDKVLLIADGVFQAAGLITMVDGVLAPSHHRAVVRTADKKVHVTPTGNGFAVFGHF